MGAGLALWSDPMLGSGHWIDGGAAAAAAHQINSEALTANQVSVTTSRRVRPTALIELPLQVSIRLPAPAGAALLPL